MLSCSASYLIRTIALPKKHGKKDLYNHMLCYINNETIAKINIAKYIGHRFQGILYIL